MHLVQDAAVPSHTRNDSHFVEPYSGLKVDPDPFHYWADSPLGLNRINAVTQALRFDSSILNQATPNPLAPVAVARIMDKTDGDLGILSPNLNIGLAEYSNANFISKGTARSTNYLYPIYSQLEFGTVETLPNGKKVRYAKFRPGFGEQDYRVGVSSRMVLFANANVPPDSIDFGLDDNVHGDYGGKLFPRAIGYSAGMIDYFFRGRTNSEFKYEAQIPFDQRPSSIGLLNLAISDSAGTEQVGPGSVRMVLKKQDVSNAGAQTFPDILVSDPVSITGNPIPSTLSFSFGSLPFPTAPLPENINIQWTEYYALIVFKGTLGQETENAVGVGGNCSYGGAKTLAFVHVWEGGYPGPHAWITQGSHSC